MTTVVADRFASILPEVPHQQSVYSIHSQPHRLDRLQVCLITLELIVCDLPPSSFYYLPFCNVDAIATKDEFKVCDGGLAVDNKALVFIVLYRPSCH